MIKRTGNFIKKHNSIYPRLIKKTVSFNKIHTTISDAIGENMIKNNENFDKDELIKEKIKWDFTKNGIYPYFFKKNNMELKIRVNEFPAEPAYTLIVNNKEITDLETWPKNWEKPNLKK